MLRCEKPSNLPSSNADVSQLSAGKPGSLSLLARGALGFQRLSGIAVLLPRRNMYFGKESECALAAPGFLGLVGVSVSVSVQC